MISWVLEHSRAEKLTRLVLVCIANHAGPDGEGWVYVAQVCQEANCSVDSYYRAVKWAEANGELVRDPNAGNAPRARADKRPNHFRFKMDGPRRMPTPQDAHPAGCPPRDPRRMPTPRPERPPQDAHPEPLVTTEPSLGAVKTRAAGFAEFYAAYPRHIGRRAAEKAWNSATKRAPPDLIVAAAVAFADVRKGQDPQYTPYPSTWLNRDQWLDVPDPPAVPREIAGVVAWANGRLL